MQVDANCGPIGYHLGMAAAVAGNGRAHNENQHQTMNHMSLMEMVLAGACTRRMPQLFGAIALFVSVLAAGPLAAQTKPADTVAASGLPLPRYASLKFDRVNLRSGPGTEYPTVWVYRKAGLPLEITKEYEAWRQVRDAEGANGWVLQSSLSGRRTALVEPWAPKADATPPQVALRSGTSEKARLIANVEAGVIANVMSCDGTW